MRTFQIIAFTVLTTLIASSCQQAQQTQQAPSQEQQQVSSDTVVLTDAQLGFLDIQTTTVFEKQMSSVVDLSGRVGVLNNDFVSISSPLGGRVVQINILPGQTFKKAEVLGRVEDQQFVDLQQDYLITCSQLVVAKENYKRQSELNATKTTSDKVFENARSQYQVLQAQKSALEQKLRLVAIDPSKVSAVNISSSVPLIAPFSGIVAEVLVNKGQYVSNTDVLFNVIDPKGYVFEFDVFEKDIAKLALGQQLSVSTNDVSESSYQASIVSVSHKVDQNGTSVVMAKSVENFPNWSLGKYVKARVSVQNVLCKGLLEQAVVLFEDRYFAFQRLSSKEFKAIELEVIGQQDDFIALGNADELEGKTLVSNGAYELLMALKNTEE